MSELTGKTAIVTGAARGIGAAIATRFAAKGARVAAFDLHPPKPPEHGLSTKVDVADDRIYSGLDGYKKVLEHLDRYDEMEPGQVETVWLRAEAYLGLDRHGKARGFLPAGR